MLRIRNAEQHERTEKQNSRAVSSRELKKGSKCENKPECSCDSAKQNTNRKRRGESVPMFKSSIL